MLLLLAGIIIAFLVIKKPKKSNKKTEDKSSDPSEKIPDELTNEIPNDSDIFIDDPENIEDDPKEPQIPEDYNYNADYETPGPTIDSDYPIDTYNGDIDENEDVAELDFDKAVDIVENPPYPDEVYLIHRENPSNWYKGYRGYKYVIAVPDSYGVWLEYCISRNTFLKLIDGWALRVEED